MPIFIMIIFNIDYDWYLPLDTDVQKGFSLTVVAALNTRQLCVTVLGIQRRQGSHSV
jgi:hypothetical protein